MKIHSVTFILVTSMTLYSTVMAIPVGPPTTTVEEPAEAVVEPAVQTDPAPPGVQAGPSIIESISGTVSGNTVQDHGMQANQVQVQENNGHGQHIVGTENNFQNNHYDQSQTNHTETHYTENYDQSNETNHHYTSNIHPTTYVMAPNSRNNNGGYGGARGQPGNRGVAAGVAGNTAEFMNFVREESTNTRILAEGCIKLALQVIEKFSKLQE